MATTTTNFGWDIPQSTDLVKDGATAIAALGQDIDTALVDLKGGTTGQVLAKASATDLDYSWVAIDPLVILDAKGDLITATAADTPARLGVGTNGQILTADSTASTGIKWATPAAATSGLTLINRSAFTAQSSVTIDSIFSSTYTTYLLNYSIFGSASSEVNMQMVYSGTVQTGSVAFSAYYGMDQGGNLRSGARSAQTSSSLGNYQASSDDRCFGSIQFSNVGNSSQKPLWTGSVNQSVCWATVLAGFVSTAQTYTGVKLFATSGTITGYVEVYGLAKA
jgi:hypothetical protein